MLKTAPDPGWEVAPAKVNLALHVTGRRDDGYHLLDSLVVFSEGGDLLRVTPATETSLTVTGPRAAGLPTGPENLALRAAALAGPGCPVSIILDKHLPSEAGIGGGSSDAAAVLRRMAGLAGGRRVGPEEAAVLGADVPVCLAPQAQRMQGVGEDLTMLEGVPPLPAVLVNPGVAVATPAVFGALAARDNPPLPPLSWVDATDFRRWLRTTRNDLEAPARALAPAIGEVLSALETTGPWCARMSGSGATCFGLYDTPKDARRAATGLAARFPGWWVAETILNRDSQDARATT